MTRAVLLLLPALLLAACASDEVRTDYLDSRATDAIKVPADLDRPRLASEVPAPPTAAEREALDPARLIPPPHLVEPGQPGVSQAPASGGTLSSLKTDANGTSYLEIRLRFDEAWRVVRLALMSSGFTLTDMDRSKGSFYIRYRDPAGEPGQDEFLLNLLEVSGGSRLLVRTPDGAMLTTPTAGRILTLLGDNI